MSGPGAVEVGPLSSWMKAHKTENVLVWRRRRRGSFGCSEASDEIRLLGVL